MAKRRKRKRRGPRPAPEPSAVTADDSRRATRPRRKQDGPPPPPWGSFPLSELVTLVGLVMLVLGFFTGPPQGPVLLVVGLVLGSLAGLELAAREHFSGYRSHAMLLGGAVGVAVSAALIFAAGVAPLIGLAGGIAVAGGAAYLLKP